MTYLAIDLGGTKTLIGVMSEAGEVTRSVKFPTPSEYAEFLIELQSSIENLINPSEIAAVCMAIPGAIDRENGVILRLGNLGWPPNTPIKSDIAKFLSCPILIENDANLAALSEAVLVKDTYKTVLYVTISTGIGGGYVVDGKLDKSLLDVELGHTVYEHAGRTQEWEDFASGSWIVKTYDKRASDIDDDKTWIEISNNIAIGMVNLIYSLNPEVIIIGGGVGAHLDKFKDHLVRAISTHDLSKMLKLPEIVEAKHAEEAVIYGCYELIKQNIR